MVCVLLEAVFRVDEDAVEGLVGLSLEDREL